MRGLNSERLKPAKPRQQKDSRRAQAREAQDALERNSLPEPDPPRWNPMG